MHKHCKHIAIVVLLFSTCFAYAVDLYEYPIEYSVLQTADSLIHADIGLSEKTGRNDGKHIRKYHEAIGLNYNNHYPYCQMFISWAFWQAGGQTFKGIKPLATAGSQRCFQNFRRYGKQSDREARKGDLLIFRVPRTNRGHSTYIVGVINGTTFETAEANTSNGLVGSQREGNGNYYRVRDISTRYGRLTAYGFCGWEYVKEIWPFKNLHRVMSE